MNLTLSTCIKISKPFASNGGTGVGVGEGYSVGFGVSVGVGFGVLLLGGGLAGIIGGDGLHAPRDKIRNAPKRMKTILAAKEDSRFIRAEK